MSKNRFRDYYLSLAEPRSDGPPEQQPPEVAAAVFLARVCIVSCIVVPIALALAVIAWVR